MSRWLQQLEKHAIHATLDQMESWIVGGLDSADENELSEVRRIMKIIISFRNLISDLDPELISFPQLDGLNNQLRHQNCWSQLTNYSNNKNVQHLVQANNHLTNALQYFRILSANVEISDKFSQIENLEELVNKTNLRLSESKEQLSKDLTTLSSELQTLDTEKDKLEEIIDERRKEIEQQVSQWQQQFSDAQDKRSEQFNDWKSSIEKEAEDKSEKAVEKIENDLSSFDLQTTEKLESLRSDAESKHGEILELYELSSGDSIAGGYAQSAHDEEEQANFWRWLSITFISLTAIWLLIVYFTLQPSSKVHVDESGKAKVQEYTVEPTNKWHKIFLSFSITGVLLFGAGYSSQQSNRHREEARKTRRFALQVKALDPYINSFSETDKVATKKSLSDKFFTGVDYTPAEEKESVESSVPVINAVNSGVKDVIKAVKGS